MKKLSSYLCIIGDLMARWTSDRWVSTLHRVIALPGQPARKSLAFFHNPDWDAEIAPLDGSGSYETVLSGQYLMSKFKSTSKWNNQIKFYDLHNFPLVQGQSFIWNLFEFQTSPKSQNTSNVEPVCRSASQDLLSLKNYFAILLGALCESHSVIHKRIKYICLLSVA